MAIKINTPLNYEPYQGKTFTGKSMTIPDQAMSVRTLLTRFANGQHLDGAKVEFYEDEGAESQGINPKTLDLVDIQIMKEQTSSRIEELKEKAQEEQKQKHAQKQQKYEEELTKKAEEIAKRNQKEPEGH